MTLCKRFISAVSFCAAFSWDFAQWSTAFPWSNGCSDTCEDKYKEEDQHRLAAFTTIAMVNFNVIFNLLSRYSYDDEILEWMMARFDGNLVVTAQDLQNYGLSLIQKEDPSFKASSGWALR